MPSTPLPRSDSVAAETVVEALNSDPAQQLLAHLDSPRTARELADRSGVALSTVYRTLERLVEAGILRTRTQIRFDGNHPTRYELAVESLTIELGGDGGLELDGATTGGPAHGNDESEPVVGR